MELIGDPNARLVYTVLGRTLAVEPPSSTTCQSSQVTVTFENPQTRTKTQVLAIPTYKNSNYDGQRNWVVVAAP
jgi:hypothetical protein